MKAVRFQGVGRQAQVNEVPKPKAASGQVVIKVGAAGVCHSDLHLMEEDFGLPSQFTLGHENAGWVNEIGQGVQGFKEGDAVAVYGPWGCGYCHACQQSMENYCENHAKLNGMGGGLGFDGGMADYMLVPSARFLVPLGSLSPAAVAVATNSGTVTFEPATIYVSCNSEREQCELPLNEKARARRIDLIGGTDGNTVG